MKKISVACICHQGFVRKNNEDNICVDGECLALKHGSIGFTRQLCCMDDRAFFFGVFDGMGGEQYGEHASYIAAKTLCEYGLQEAADHDKSMAEMLGDYISLANQKVLRERDSFQAGTIGTTASVIGVRQNKVCICNIGDSPILVYHDGALIPKYEEHTDRGFLIKNNVKSRRPCLTQYLGIDPQEMILKPFLQTENGENDDIYMICSDGLTNSVKEYELKIIFSEKSSLQEKADRLLDRALNNGGKDNISIILLQCTKGEQQ